ncbi:MAG: hypothetical protein II122_03690 [Bacteroidaceae bacterium]|jgi:hypothetical protein|nr:hypothetical protein [Bacteroidaceae bacterium]HAE23944.1 hypothetical protein [Prevotellaceae bacterium]
MKNVSLLLLGVCLLAACGKSRIPDGYYVNKDATGISCVVFQIKGDTIIWQNDYRQPGKAFKYTLSSGKIKGHCLTEDENLEKDYKFVDDSIIVNKQMFVPFNPHITKLPEGNYENYMSVPLETFKLRIFGDSAELKSYRYDELLLTTRNKIAMKGSDTIVVSYNNDSVVKESKILAIYDGFIVNELRYVKID